MLKRLMGILAVGVLALSATAASAGVAKNDLCAAKKEAEVGKNVLGLLKAFGKNNKVPNTAKLSDEISKAQSKITKGFTKAEFTRNGDDKGCAVGSVGDVGAIEDKAEGLVQDVLDDLIVP